MTYTMPINRAPKIPFAVGIDPDVKGNGFAVWSRKTRTLNYCDCMILPEMLTKIAEIDVGMAEFYVDAGWLNEGYHHYGQLPDGFDTWELKSQWAYMVSCGIKVGRNFGVGQAIVLCIKQMGHPVHEIKPVTEKWDKHDLKRYTGWIKRTNQDARDAAKLCFQR